MQWQWIAYDQYVVETTLGGLLPTILKSYIFVTPAQAGAQSDWSYKLLRCGRMIACCFPSNVRYVSDWIPACGRVEKVLVEIGNNF